VNDAPTWPPELDELSDDEMQALRDAIIGVALRRTKSKRRAEELWSDVLAKLCTTRRWDPQKAPLLPYAFGILKSELSHQEEARAREVSLRESYQREVNGASTSSAEDDAIARFDREERQAAAKTVLLDLRARVADHPIALEVLRYKDEGVDKPAAIAVALGVPVKKVYDAIDLLKYHLKKLRKQNDENV
jgi:DNA-directed RNA polymerase specialized sigma24 family protein